MKKKRRWGRIRRIYVSHMASSSAYKRAWIVLGCTINLIIRKFFLLRIYKNQLKCVGQQQRGGGVKQKNTLQFHANVNPRW